MAVVSNWSTWASQIKPFPGGIVGRVTPLLLSMLLYGVDVWMGATEYLPEPALLLLAIPYLPLASLAFGVLPAIVAWFASLLIIGMLGYPGSLVFGLLFPSMLVMGTFCYLMPWKTATWTPVAAIAAALGLNRLLPGTDLPPTLVLCLLTGLAAAAGLGLNLYRGRHEKQVLRIRELELEKTRVREEERIRLAHELHDIVAHDVTIMAMQARRAEFVNDPRKTSEILAGIGEAAQQTLQDLRSLVMLLKEETVQGAEVPETAGTDAILAAAELSGETTTAVGLVHDIDKVVEALKRADYRVDLVVEGDVARIPASQRQALRRTVRELGTNVLKHADPRGPVQLQLCVGATEVVLNATNQCAKSAPIMSSQTGLEAMKARCQVFGGYVEAGEFADRWSTSVTIPLEGLTTGI